MILLESLQYILNITDTSSIIFFIKCFSFKKYSAVGAVWSLLALISPITSLYRGQRSLVDDC